MRLNSVQENRRTYKRKELRRFLGVVQGLPQERNRHSVRRYDGFVCDGLRGMGR